MTLGRIISERAAMEALHVGPRRFHELRKAGVIVPVYTEDSGRRVYSTVQMEAQLAHSGRLAAERVAS